MARKKYNYNFIRKKSDGGRNSVRIAGAAFLLMLLSFGISFAFRGEGSIALGGIGLFSILLSAYGFMAGLKSFREEQVSHKLSVVGSISSGIVFLLWLTLFLIGI